MSGGGNFKMMGRGMEVDGTSKYRRGWDNDYVAEIADDETADKAFRNIEFELEEGETSGLKFGRGCGFKVR